jgi:hypothetical protein
VATLRDLNACFIRREVRVEPYRRVRAEVYAARPLGPFEEGDIEEVVGDVVYLQTVDSLTEADGLFYLCPKCFAANGGPIGTHSVLNWFVGHVADDVDPKPGRWVPSGSGIDIITFIGPAAASVLLTSGCKAHYFVRNGAIEDLT